MEQGRRKAESEKTTQHRTQNQRRRGGTGRKVLSVLGTLILIGLCTTLMIAGIFMVYVKTTLTPVLQVDAADYTMNLSSIIYYHDDTVVENGGWVECQVVHGEENRIWVDYDQIPTAMWQAAVAIEDEDFFDHHGVDWSRTLGATVNMFLGMRDTFGGSTITQQALKNMTGDNAGTVNRKIREIFRALEFEKNYTKQDILELYLNLIYLGKGCYGVQTAAEFYFGKDVSELSVAECACLIAITNNPSMYGPLYDIEIEMKRDDGSTVIRTPRQLNKQRQEMILKYMYKQGYIETEEELETALSEELHFTDGSVTAKDLVDQVTGGESVNSWFVDQVIMDVSADLAEKYDLTPKEARRKLYNGGYRIYTTMDPKVQKIAEDVYEDRSNLNVTSRSGQKLCSGMTIVEPSTGDVVAMVGNVGEKTVNLGWNYAVGRRQVGSSLKPLTVYAPALDAGVITNASTFDNYPVRLLNGKPWPKNSPNQYTGWTTLATGVAKSINTVAVQVVEKLGIPESYEFATKKLNLPLEPEDMNVGALGLGGLTKGLNTVEMAAAYASFANNGVYHEPRTYVKVTNDAGEIILENENKSHVAMKDTTAYFMNELLKGVVNGGTGSSANFGGMTIAGKTGTTSNNYDRYFVGYTPYYAAAVWTGYDKPERISYSGNPAITMWKKVMKQVHADLPNVGFRKPAANFVNVSVCADSGLLATEACGADLRGSRVHTVTVLQGTAPKEHCSMHVMKDYCPEGDCLAGEFCPAGSIVQRSFLDYSRTSYGVAVSDSGALLSTWTAKDPCPVHSGQTVPLPDDPSGGEPPEVPEDPDHPSPVDPAHPSGGESGTPPPSPPPVTPEPPKEDWVDNLWG